MPVFTFEKLSPPVRRSPTVAAEKKQRSRLVQLLDRLAEARTRRALSKNSPEVAEPQKPLE
ncbi:hypothetical protein [Bradyrhizobium sp. Tv2a-2]|jgi:hypothetical protein|uniref:hypothetical protein n=1 Tax=Bradyrhizobium sp. Tv2a-2 TaxID=113395 RepID=UPI00040C03F0|nr:hypothetical protein [Bradyrhizobium sp. Tv2a-2]